MPTYDYRCDNCGHELEAFQSITAKPLKKCPECGKLKLQRLLGTGAGLIFKGSGFYETDYRSDSYKKAAQSEKPKTESAKTDSKKETKKAETKPAAKAKSESRQ
jgi:putative FmdB family regulatory protein